MSTANNLRGGPAGCGGVVAIRIGEPFPFGAPPYPEYGEFNYDLAGYGLQLFMKDPRSYEVKAVRNEPVEFAVTVVGRVIFLLYRFGLGGKGIPWSDSAFSYHLVSPANRSVPDEPQSDDDRALVHIELVDAETGIVRALRVVTFPPAVTRVLAKAIREQAQQHWRGEKEYRAEVATICERHSVKDLLSLATARGFGGR